MNVRYIPIYIIRNTMVLYKFGQEHLDLLQVYASARHNRNAPNPALAAILGNAPTIIITPTDSQNSDLGKERLSDCSSVVHNHGRALRSERSGKNEADFGFY